jgi:hypothetical protein
MRRTSVLLAVLSTALLAAPGGASALPTVKFKAEAVPIPGYQGTGYILGAGAAAKGDFEVTGNEYFGSPPPVIGVNVYLPSHTKLDPHGFPTCNEELLRLKGPIGCPKGSEAGPVGSVLGYVTFGGERVEETAENFSFFSPTGGFTFFTFGHSPVNLEVYSHGEYVNLVGGGGFGPELKVKVPLVASVPGAPYASVKSIKAMIGAARGPKNEPKKDVYYGRVPTSCPKGGFKVKTEVIFAENGEESKPETVTAPYTLPCPRGKKR